LTSIKWTQETLMSKNIGTIDFHYIDTRNTDVKNILESLTSIVRTQETLMSKKILEPLTSIVWTQETLISKNIGTIDFHCMDTRNTDVKKILEPLTSIVWTQETLMSKKYWNH